MSNEQISPLAIKKEIGRAKAHEREATKRAVIDTLRTGVRMYLYGIHDEIKTFEEEGSGAIRVGGQLLEHTLHPNPQEAVGCVQTLYEADVMWQSSSPHMVSFIAARLAEGIYEAGNQATGRYLAENIVDDSHKAEVEEYFRLKDDGLIRPHHA